MHVPPSKVDKAVEKGPTMRSKMVFLIAVLALLVAACGSDEAELPLAPTDDNPPPAAGACHEDEPDCDDTPGDIGAPVDLPDVDPTDIVELFGVDALVDSAPEGVVTAQGFYIDDADGTRLCSLLAESLPPQCGGASIPLEGPVAFETQTSQGVSWTDVPVVVVGELIDGAFVISSGRRPSPDGRPQRQPIRRDA